MRKPIFTATALAAAVLLAACGTGDGDSAATGDAATSEAQSGGTPAGDGKVTINYDGRVFELAAFQCLRDYPSPVDPDTQIALALDAAAPGVPEDLLAPLRGVPDSNSGNPMEAMTSLLAQGPVLSVARYASGMDVVTFYPTANPDDAVFAAEESGFLEASGSGIQGTAMVSPDGESERELKLTAQCP